jgi:TRAP-type C4-dicarboxylate transport system permease large subunit
MMVVVVGGILVGYFTATESAVIAVVYVLVAGFATRTLTVGACRRSSSRRPRRPRSSCS